MTALLDVRNLQVTITAPGGSKPILDDVSFHLAPAEALGLVGESGSGKSTTARAVLGALPPNAYVQGQVRLDGADIYQMTRAALRERRSRSVALIGQNPSAAMNPVRRVGDYAAEALRANLRSSAGQARQRLARLLCEVGIDAPDRVLDQYPHQLSGGMLQRVVIAAALAAEPALLIADEPTSALDMTTQADVVAVFNRLRHTHRTALLFITHDLDLAAAVCDRTAVMYAGRIVEEQASARLHEYPQHPYSAGLARARTRVDIDVARLQAIPGSPVAAFENTETGCSFAPRCSFDQPRCRQASPALATTSDGRVACWRHTELASLLTKPAPAPPEYQP